MARLDPTKERIFPALNQADKDISSSLFKQPDFNYLTENLKHHLRDYQFAALLHLHWAQQQIDADQNYQQVLFNMATGSGKTDVMAAAILYLFHEHGFNDFIFVSNTTAVVEKTRANFLKPASAKYLFANPIVIRGERINIKAVDTFPVNQDENTIYLKLTTIQTLASELTRPSENQLTYADLARHKLVLLADEAHHFNVDTKKRVTKKARDEQSWESVLDNIRAANPANRQLEFTATIDVNKPEVYQKYKNKIIYRYDLRRFMREGYSKKVYRLQANGNNKQKLLNAILLSQYRKRIAQKLAIPDLKPVVLVKSNHIKSSKMVKTEFLQMMADLSSEQLRQFIVTNQKINTQSQALTKTYHYWLTQDLIQAVGELKQDFNKLTTIDVNEAGSKGILADENDFNKLNTLEEVDNPFRIIFAVAKLTEGWDVLNLFDIVRVAETNDPVTRMKTNAEAQLIGRGARYYPFLYHGKRSFKRRFDQASGTAFEKQLLESLYYHTINESKYISSLNKSFDKMNLIVHRDDVHLSAAAKNSACPNPGLHPNKDAAEKQVADYRTIADYGVDGSTIVIDYNLSTIQESFHSEKPKSLTAEVKYSEVVNFAKPQDYRLIKRAIARNKFYRFATIKKYLPRVKSIHEFLTSEKWLGNLRVDVKLAQKDDLELTSWEKLHILDEALAQIQEMIVKNYPGHEL